MSVICPVMVTGYNTHSSTAATCLEKEPNVIHFT